MCRFYTKKRCQNVQSERLTKVDHLDTSLTKKDKIALNIGSYFKEVHTKWQHNLKF